MPPFDPPFSGSIKPPDVPPDPSGDEWRGEPGPPGPTGPQGPQGLPGSDTSPVRSVAGKIGDVTLVHTDITDWTASTNFLPLAGGTLSGALTISSSGGFGLSLPNSSAVFGSSTTPGFLRLQGAAGSTRQLQLNTLNVARWTVSASNIAESGNNAGSAFEVNAYNDSPGTFLGSLMQGQRTSGALGVGAPHFTSLAPFTQSVPRVAVPGGSIGNYQNFLGNGDTQAIYTLGADPLSVTSGSPTVTVTWVGAGLLNGLINKTGWEVWVNLLGATAVGGITPTGWLKVASFPDNDHLTVAWTSNATSTATGGGTSVTVQPSFSTQVNQVTSTTRYGGGGFVNQATELWEVNPYFLPLQGQASPRYLQRWHWTCGPPCDAAHNFSLAGVEWDLTNRGPDMGYSPDAGGTTNNTTGLWMGATVIPPWAAGGGTASNWNMVYAVYSQQGTVGSYIGYNVQPNALVGAARDPTGHGGVGVDVFGSYVNLPGAPFTTATGTSTVTVNIGPGALNVQSNGSTVWLPNVVTIAGVTFGGASYTIAGVDKVLGKFTITGTGTAAASISGGGAGQWLAFANLAPYAPYQIWGDFKHGLISTNARFESGGIIETQPGNGMLWSDGTGTASINSSAPSAGNINVSLTPAGTGQVIASGPLTLNAGGTFSGTIAGAHTYSGATTFSAAGTAMSVTNNATIGGTFGVTGNSTMTGSLIVGNAASTSILRLQGAVNQAKTLQFTNSNVSRWNVSVAANPPSETGGNTGANFRIDAFSDTGAFIANLLEGNRTSGPMNGGAPWLNIAPFRQAAPMAARPNGITGNLMTFPARTDTQPTFTLANNPLSVTSGSPTVTVTWVGACVTNGILSPGYDLWVLIGGATAVGGITPTGWFRVASIVDNDHFTITWTSNATSTATGGGAAVTIRPSFTTTVNWVQSGIGTSGSGFPNQDSQLLSIDPEFYSNDASLYPRYQQSWKWVVGPNDTSGLYNWNVAAVEYDLTNRGLDHGYSPNLSGALNTTIGYWVGPKGGTPPTWSTGGGTGTHWNTVYAVFSDAYARVYDALNIQPNALVGAAEDPTGHGGVGVDVFGAYTPLPGSPFQTTVGTSTIRIAGGGNSFLTQTNGNTVWVPNVITLAGVTFGGASYVMSNVTTNSCTITGTGTASATISGGGAGQWLAFANLVPYAPYQFWGSFKHGLISTNARIESGGIIETQPGNGMLWNDGTGTASINSSAISAGNLNVDITPAGTGTVVVHGPVTATNLPRVVSTTGQTSVTGVTTETNLAALRIPAGSLGLNGWAMVTAVFSYTNSANTKTLQARFNPTSGSTGGGSIGSFAVTATASAQLLWIVRNNNSQAAQNTFVSPNVPFGAAGANLLPTTTNTASDTWININGLLANSGETITLVHASVVIYPS